MYESACELVTSNIKTEEGSLPYNGETMEQQSFGKEQPAQKMAINSG